MRRLVLLGAAALGLIGCSFPLQLRTRFDRVGEYRGDVKARPIVASAEDVKVYYDSAPDGFSLRENELKVEDGYPHEILGTVMADYFQGNCHDGNGRKVDVIRALQQAAFDNGGNAVIYVRSKLADQSPMPREACPTTKEPYGSGWAVIVRDQAPSDDDEPTE